MPSTYHLSPNSRIRYNGIQRNAQEWATVMGYDYDTVYNFHHSRGIPLKEVISNLAQYVYDGKDCKYHFKDNRHPTNLVGMRFGRLKVESQEGRLCTCKCDCSNVIKVLRKDLLNRDYRSCGCLMRENQLARKYATVNGIKQDCMTLTFKGRTLTVTEWARQSELIEKGIKRRNIYHRIRRGWTVEDALSRPCKTKSD